MKHEVRRREVTVNLVDAERATGTTTGLRTRTIEPVRVTFTTYFGSESEVFGLLEGPGVRENGTLGAAHYKVKVDLTGRDRYEPAPEWVHTLARKVVR